MYQLIPDTQIPVIVPFDEMPESSAKSFGGTRALVDFCACYSPTRSRSIRKPWRSS